MSDIDNRIREALAEGTPPEERILAQLAATFRGSNRRLALMSWFGGFLFTALAVVAGIQLWGAREPRLMVLWASGLSLCAVVLAMVKVWYWLELARLSVLRELKRMEHRIAVLAERRAGSA